MMMMVTVRVMRVVGVGMVLMVVVVVWRRGGTAQWRAVQLQQQVRHQQQLRQRRLLDSDAQQARDGGTALLLRRRVRSLCGVGIHAQQRALQRRGNALKRTGGCWCHWRRLDRVRLRHSHNHNPPRDRTHPSLLPRHKLGETVHQQTAPLSL